VNLHKFWLLTVTIMIRGAPIIGW